MYYFHLGNYSNRLILYLEVSSSLFFKSRYESCNQKYNFLSEKRDLLCGYLPCTDKNAYNISYMYIHNSQIDFLLTHPGKFSNNIYLFGHYF